MFPSEGLCKHILFFRYFTLLFMYCWCMFGLTDWLSITPKYLYWLTSGIFSLFDIIKLFMFSWVFLEFLISVHLFSSRFVFTIDPWLLLSSEFVLLKNIFKQYRRHMLLLLFRLSRSLSKDHLWKYWTESVITLILELVLFLL